MKIALLLTGNELMAGDTVDSNSSMIAQKLSVYGFQVDYKVTIGDDLDLLVEELERLSLRYSIVLVNGGLGPTIDDLTAEAVALATGGSIQKNLAALAHLNVWCAERNIRINDANLKQAMLPDCAEIIDNPNGSAVGFYVNHNECLIACTPGVPSELTTMLDEQIAKLFSREFPNAQSKLIRRLKVFGVGESRLQQLVADNISDWPPQVALGFRAGLPSLELKLEIEDDSDMMLRNQCEDQIRELIGNYIIGENDETLPEILVDILEKRGEKVCVAESCTGGRIAAEITSIAGASNVFDLGVVAYSNKIKASVLGVPSLVLDRYGAVSEETVKAMANGALRKSDANYAIAVSGIAGPSGGTAEKPVGTVWVAWGGKDRLFAAEFRLPAKRGMFQTLVAAIALDLLRRYLSGNYETPNYFGRR